MLPGLVQWFPFEDRALVARACDALAELRATELRTLFSWADWTREDGPAWFDWFVGELAHVPGLRLLPSLFYTPPHLARRDADGAQKTSYPPEDACAYAAYVGEVIDRYGRNFDWVQLWNEPNWKPYWDWDMDPDGSLFAQLFLPAAAAAHARGKRVVLGGTTPLDYAWFAQMERHGVLAPCDAVSFHFSPSWEGLERHAKPLSVQIDALRALMRGYGHSPQVWGAEIGFSTCTKRDTDSRRLEQEQVAYFDAVRAAPFDRTYWYALLDQDNQTATDDAITMGVAPDPTAYHFGLITADGRKKPLYDHWKRLAS